MNILITGCNGQLGNEMQLLEKQNPQHTYYNTDVAELDITDQAAIMLRLPPIWLMPLVSVAVG